MIYAWNYIKSMAGFAGREFNYINIFYFLNKRTVFTILVAVTCSVGLPCKVYDMFSKRGKAVVQKLKYPMMLALLMISLFMVIYGNYSPFIYFRF